MRVCLDCQVAWSQRAGVGRVVRGLATHLPKARNDDEIRLFSFADERPHHPVRAQPHERIVPFLPGRWVRRAWRGMGAPPFDWLAGPADVYHFPNFVRPPLSRGRSVVTIYDTSFLRFPETVEPKNLAYLRSQIGRTARLADAFLATSRSAAAAIEEGLRVSADRIYTAPPGLDAIFSAPEAGRVAAVRARLGLAKPYLLFVGTLEPRKNVSFLVDLFDALDAFDGELVVAGALGWKHEPILARMRAARRAGAIRFVGRVADDALPGLYAGAEAFLFPSLDEGFGFPPVEAMACGTPVVSSAAGALPEVLSDGACIVADLDVDAWSCALRTLLEDPAERARLVERGRSRSGLYAWDEAAERTWSVYRAVAA